MRTSWDHTECRNLKTALSREWLETNGLGGYASSTIIGANTRRQHGLLVAALEPPGARCVLLSKLEEIVSVDGQQSHLSTNLYPGTVFPHGFNIQNEFRLQPWPIFRYAGAGFEIEKSICLLHGENTLLAAYHNRQPAGPWTLRVRPLLAFRDSNRLSHRHTTVDLSVERRDGVLSVKPYAELPRLFFHFSPCEVNARADWYLRLTYPVDQARGFEYEEDLFSPFELIFRWSGADTVYVAATTEPVPSLNIRELLEAERRRRQPCAGHDPMRAALLTAAEKFLARRGKEGLTIVSGYPWFTDSGRGGMIALPGLTLSTGRFEEARRILNTFAAFCKRGLIPNLFPDGGDKASYNSVDASLWFIVATWQYWKACRNDEALRELFPVLRDIVRWYQEGTQFDIRADTDGLIHAGGPGSQLTWMDVKLEGYVPTPRHGKPVEINALWFNALLMLAEIEETIGKNPSAASELRQKADHLARRFVRTFWFAEGGYLYDVIQGDYADPSVRPNQIYAVSLPYSPLTLQQQQSVFQIVTEQLLTPYGLRTLAPQHEKYVRRYTGTRWQRDAARHQGTVWPFLIGAYADAFLRVRGHQKTQRRKLRALLQPLLDHLADAGLGSVCEMFDADPPHYPQGCPFSACSVAELLRAYDLCQK